jgi:hypothetical protein
MFNWLKELLTSDTPKVDPDILWNATKDISPAPTPLLDTFNQAALQNTASSNWTQHLDLYPQLSARERWERQQNRLPTYLRARYGCRPIRKPYDFWLDAWLNGNTPTIRRAARAVLRKDCKAGHYFMLDGEWCHGVVERPRHASR